MALDLQSSFGLHLHCWTHWLRLPQLPPPSPPIPHLARTLLVSQDRRHLFVTPCLKLSTFPSGFLKVQDIQKDILNTIFGGSKKQTKPRREAVSIVDQIFVHEHSVQSARASVQASHCAQCALSSSRFVLQCKGDDSATIISIIDFKTLSTSS